LYETFHLFASEAEPNTCALSFDRAHSHRPDNGHTRHHVEELELSFVKLYVFSEGFYAHRTGDLRCRGDQT
jgi:hypothetical protein